MKTANDLKQILDTIDRRSYPAYKSIQGQYDFKKFVLSVDHVQGDPFASPSKISLLIKQEAAGFPKELYDKPYKRIALEDHITRIFSKKLNRFSHKASGSGKSGLLSVSRPGQEVLERTACQMDAKQIIARLEIGLPANGRTINSGELKKIFYEYLPPCVDFAFYYQRLDEKQVWDAVHLAEDQEYIRGELIKRGLTAFVANGSILPRESGISAKPLKDAVPFQSPEALETGLTLPYKGSIKGMGIPKGITLIVGGGYHGKSTLLKAIELGVYNHVKGDGREYVITDNTAVKIRAEDGRSIESVDISTFINRLPNGKDTIGFSTRDASGSTSQAANVVEALEAGSSLLLIDEDTSATNFMVRDRLMQQVISRDMEPITPYIDVVKTIYESLGVSTILVAGSSGAWFHKADIILQMDSYHTVDITEKVREICKDPAFQMPEEPFEPKLHLHFDRVPCKIKDFPQERNKIRAHSLDSLEINHEMVDLRFVEQLADPEQTAALAYLLKNLLERIDGKKTLQELVAEIWTLTEKKGLSGLAEGSWLPCFFARPRKQELFAAVNRYRKLAIPGGSSPS